MSGAIVPAIVVGGVAYVALKGSGATATLPGGTIYGTPTSGQTLPGISGNGVNPGGTGSSTPGLVDPSGQSAFNLGGRATDPDAQQKVDLLGLTMQKAYDGMSAAAKSTAADQLNQQLNLDPPLTGNETWEQVARVAGAATAGVACNAIPGVGTAASPLCAMAGAYLGVQFEQWMSTELPGLQQWVTDNVGAVVDSIGNTLDDWFHSIF